MKNLIILLLLMPVILFSQEVELDSEFFGVYTGEQKGYTLKDKFGDDMILMGNKVIIPSSEHKFMIQKDNVVSMKQTALDGSMSPIIYEGSYKVDENTNSIIIECLVSAIGDDGVVTYVLTIDKSTMKMTCLQVGNTGVPAFVLKNPMLDKKAYDINFEIDKEKIANYRKLSVEIGNLEKLNELKKLLSSLKNNYSDLSQELSDLDKEIQKDKIDSFIKKNDFISARKIVDQMDKNDISEEVLEKIYPNYKILKKVYNDIYKAEGFENYGNDANVYILLYLLNLSSIEFKNAKWFKGAFGTSKLVLMGFDNKLYGGLGWRQAAGLQFKLDKISSSSLPKIKNSLISQVPLLKQKRSDMKTESYVDKDDLTNVEYIFGRKISDHISPNEFYRLLRRKSKNNKGYPSGDVFKIRYGDFLRVK